MRRVRTINSLPPVNVPNRLPPGALDLARRRFAYHFLTQGEPREDVARALCSALGMSKVAAARLDVLEAAVLALAKSLPAAHAAATRAGFLQRMEDLPEPAALLR